MSLILDALKKSEKSRHDAANSVLPLIVTPRRGQRPKRNAFPFLPLLIILLALAGIGLVYYLTDDNESTIERKSVKAESAVSTPEIVTSERAELVARPQSETTPQPTPVESLDRNSARQEILQRAGILSTVDTSKIPPRLAKMSADLQKAVSPLRLDFHVFSSDRKRRIIFINGAEFKEGMSVKENLNIIRIVPDGAVMEWKDEKFLLTVQD